MNIKKKTIIWQIIAVIGLNLAYALVISDKFNYMGFSFTFNFMKLLLGSVVLISTVFLNYFIKDEFIFAVWNIIYIYLFAGEMIYFQYNKGASFTQLISIGAVLIFLIFVSRSNKVFGKVKKIKNINLILTILSVIFFIPFVVFYYRYIDIKNIFLINVYQTRALFRTISKPLTGYMTAPLVRIILPVLIAKNLERKKLKNVIIFFLMIVYVYLCGALKSVFIGLLALLLFYPGNYSIKVNRFLKAICFLTFVGVFIAINFDNLFLLDSLVRRVFFTPAYVNNIYIEYFTDNFTYLSHSPFGFGMVESNLDRSLSMYVGEVVMGSEGLNANVGLFTEGYISFGYIGILLFSLLISAIFKFIKMTKIDPKYFGIVFVYIYYANTAFLSTLLLTHGLLFFLIFSLLFLRKEK